MAHLPRSNVRCCRGQHYCVFDALDECRDSDRSKLIAKLSQFHYNAASQKARQAWLKFIATSRPYDDIQRGFEEIPASLPAIRLRGEEENDRIRAEIDCVIKIRVLQLANSLQLQLATAARLEQTTRDGTSHVLVALLSH